METFDQDIKYQYISKIQRIGRCSSFHKGPIDGNVHLNGTHAQVYSTSKLKRVATVQATYDLLKFYTFYLNMCDMSK